MKTKEEIKSEIINYLEKTSSHTFIKPLCEYYSYDYDNYTLFKIIKKDDNYYKLENNIIKLIDIDFYVKYYGNNSKNVIKHLLFLNKGMKSIKNTKFIKNKLEELQLVSV
jgi:hypothetical protein